MAKYKAVKLSPITYQRLKTICSKYLPAILQKPKLSFDMCISLILDDLEETIAEYLEQNEKEETKRERKSKRAKEQRLEYRRYYIPPPP